MFNGIKMIFSTYAVSLCGLFVFNVVIIVNKSSITNKNNQKKIHVYENINWFEIYSFRMV